jgi:hypothetical protein
MQDVKPIEKDRALKARPFPLTPSHDKFEEPEPILDPTCGFEEMDRGEGMAVDDIKTYHRTEK